MGWLIQVGDEVRLAAVQGGPRPGTLQRRDDSHTARRRPRSFDAARAAGADATIAFVGRDRWADGGVSLSHSLWAALVNGYVDLGTFVGITPYVGSGLGIARARDSIELGALTASRTQNRFAYALNAGAAYRMTDNVSLDVGYQFLHSPNMRYWDLDTGEDRSGVAHFYHSAITPVFVKSGQSRVLPLPPEFVVPQDGSEKQDCERGAAKRWLAQQHEHFSDHSVTYLGDDLQTRSIVCYMESVGNARSFLSAAREVALALIFGGALGNLVDRITTGLVVVAGDITTTAYVEIPKIAREHSSMVPARKL